MRQPTERQIQAAIIELPFPHPSLSPNASNKNWYCSDEARKTAKQLGAAQARNTGIELSKGDYQITVTFYPPDKRRRDLDNLLASMKPSLDGMCAGYRIDDSQIKRITVQWGAREPWGKVTVEISLLDDIS